MAPSAYLLASDRTTGWVVVGLLVIVGLVLILAILAPFLGLLWGMLHPRRYAAQNTSPRRVPIPAEIKASIIARDGYRCVECGATQDLQVDHILAVHNGGGNEVANLQTLCGTCNRSKGIYGSVEEGRRAGVHRRANRWVRRGARRLFY